MQLLHPPWRLATLASTRLTIANQKGGVAG
jgi:hypothetical protein